MPDSPTLYDCTFTPARGSRTVVQVRAESLEDAERLAESERQFGRIPGRLTITISKPESPNDEA